MLYIYDYLTISMRTIHINVDNVSNKNDYFRLL